MNTKISILMAAGALALAATSCSDSWEPNTGTEQGSLSLKSMGVNVNTSSTVFSRAESGAIDLKPYLVKIVPTGGGETLSYTYGTMPEILALAVGEYEVEVESHSVQPAEWDRPYYKGTSGKFNIRNNEVTEIGVVNCTFASLKVTIAYADDLKPLLGDDVKVDVVANNGGTLSYGKDETRSGYFQVIEGSTTLAAHFEGTVSGVKTVQDVTFTDVKPGVHYILTFKVKNAPEPPEQTGTVDPGGITIEGVVEEQNISGGVNPGEDNPLDPGTRPGTEDPEQGSGDDPNPPTPPVGDDPITFTSSTLDLNGINDATQWAEGGPLAGTPAAVTIASENGFSHLLVTIDSDKLTPDLLVGVGLAAQFDLANPVVTDADGSQRDLTAPLTNFGFPIGTQVTGATAPIEFNIGDFVPLLNIYPNGSHNFIITVTDKNGVQKAMTLKFKS